MGPINYRLVQNAYLRTLSRVMIFGNCRDFFPIFNLRMASLSKVIILPDTVRGMKQLDREKFCCNIKVCTLKLQSEKINCIMPICKPYVLKLENLKPVQHLTEEYKPFDRYIILNPEKVTSWCDIPEDDRVLFSQHAVTEDNLDQKDLNLTYENFKYDDIFKAVLPEGAETVSGFSHIGHIIHLNLRDHLLEYKSLIGAVLIDKIKTCRTVVNKIHTIDNTFRNINLELLAGDEDYLVTVKENNCKFQFDFSKVYWNPRLGREHERILQLLKPDDILFDVFAGVGPFAVPAAKKKCRVFANDLNPESFKALNYNAKHNSVNMSLIKTYNLDGQEFICKIFKDFIKDCCTGKENIPLNAIIHVTMNLPALAVEFLKYFKGLIDDKSLLDNFNLDIVVYVYCFVTEEDTIGASKKKVIDNVGQDVTSEILDVAFVRNVAPKKDMMRVSLKLTKDILFGVASNQEESEPPLKKKCVESMTE